MAYTQEQIDSGEAYDIWWKKFAVYKARQERPRRLASANIGMLQDFENYKPVQTRPINQQTSDNYTNIHGPVWTPKRPRKQTIEGFTRGQS